EAGDLKVRCPYCQSPVTSIATQENRKLNPLSIYGMTKLQQEQLCSQLAMHFQLPVTILRYFNVYGSRQSLKNPYTGVASILYSRLNANQPLFLYEQGTPERDFVHVADVARANLLALSTDVDPGSCFNVGSGANSSIRSIALSLAKATGRKADIRETGDFRVGDIHSCFADLTRSAESLNYKPEVSLEDGMMEFASWASGEETKDLYSVSADELRSHNLMGSADSP
ncbi:MAG: NAD-dependent epimerase/dehydratase family protein, partial [Cyanobacteria bacterium P01_F01_bin.3]